MPCLVQSHTSYTSPHHEKTVKLESNNHADLFSQEPPLSLGYYPVVFTCRAFQRSGSSRWELHFWLDVFSLSREHCRSGVFRREYAWRNLKSKTKSQGTCGHCQDELLLRAASWWSVLTEKALTCLYLREAPMLLTCIPEDARLSTTCPHTSRAALYLGHLGSVYSGHPQLTQALVEGQIPRCSIWEILFK